MAAGSQKRGPRIKVQKVMSYIIAIIGYYANLCLCLRDF